MGENEKKQSSNSDCYCQSWKAIFIAIAFMVIGAFLYHVIAGKSGGCCRKGMYGHSYRMKACGNRWDRDGYGRFENKFRQGKKTCGQQKKWSQRKDDMSKCKPGCTCPKCSKKSACSKKDKKKDKIKKD